MTDEPIESLVTRLEGLMALATPGEWEVFTIASSAGVSERLFVKADGVARDLAHIPMEWPKNGDCIVALVNAAPRLLRELREARAALVTSERYRKADAQAAAYDEHALRAENERLSAALRAMLTAKPQCECSDASGCGMAAARAQARAALAELETKP